MKSFRAAPLSDKIQKPQSHEKITFQAPKTVAKHFPDAPHSKALESVCLFRPHGWPIATQSLKGHGEGMVFYYLASEKSNFLPGDTEAMACL